MKPFTYFPFVVILIFPFLFSTCHQGSSLSQSVPAGHPKVIGQTAPLDMVFIPGEGDIPSFYMGVSEEPNINYLLYLKWTKSVFGESYPEVYENAQPKRHIPTRLMKYNDPLIKAYMTHPAFSYYPVTGLSWIQIQEYLRWKSDRLNETILIELGILNFSFDQKDEDNFSTEAYLYGQYQGSVRKNLRDLDRGEERAVRFDDGLLFPGFRLPTEAEWEYASQVKFQKAIDREKCLDPFSEAAISAPLGENYYLLNWSDLDDIPEYELYAGEKGIVDRRLRPLSYTPDEHDRAGKPQRLTSIGEFDQTAYGLANMEGNVREWVMDFYRDTFAVEIKDPLVIMERSGFRIKDPMVLDEDGEPVEKDSIGRLRYFRMLGVNSNGEALNVGDYKSESTLKQKRKRDILRKIEFIKKRLDKIAVQPEYFSKKKLRMASEIEVLEYFLGEEKTVEEKQRILHYSFYEMLKKDGQQGWKQNLKMLRHQYKEVDPQQLKKSLGELYMEWGDIETYLANDTTKRRLVKGGTWEKPGKQRMALGELESNVEVGFRCVLPYTGIPVANKWKVKWGK